MQAKLMLEAVCSYPTTENRDLATDFERSKCRPEQF